MKALHFYNKCLSSRPLLTKAISGCFVFALGDYLCQKVENHYIFHTPNAQIKWKRVLKQASFGFVVAPYLHLQYNILVPWLFPEALRFSTAKAVAYAVTVSDGIFTIVFFSYMNFINGRNMKEALVDVPKKTVPVMINNLKIWPFLTGFNFTFVPFNFRVLFDNGMCIFWNIYLSYVENTQFSIGKKV